MNLAEFSIKKKTIVIVLVILMIGGGLVAFDKLGRLEDPEFTIKDAQVITIYPGASPQEVEEEVTDRIETAIQQMSQLRYIQSLSKAGVSTITVTIHDKYDKAALPQVWDELRRKVNDVQHTLPPGAQTSIVNDDYGDVFGILLALTGPGYSYKELEEYSDFLRRELLLVKDVAKVQVYGVQPQEVHVEISRSKLAALGISLNQIYLTLKLQNVVTPAGSVRVGDDYIRINPTGDFTSVEEIGNLLLRGTAESGNLTYLRDVATITHGYQTPPTTLNRFNGENALVLGISVISGGNVVNMGDAIKTRLAELVPQSPIGMKLDIISFQSDSVTEAIQSFLISLAEALAIVIVILMMFMGLRSGLIIGAALILTVLGTLIGMSLWGISLERISLGALIIALGMLVDNAIVVTEGMLIRIQAGENRSKAAKKVVGQTSMPLLGATFIAILAFAAIGLSQDSTGEYTRSLFQVILISLMLSWLLAMTVTPLMCKALIKAKPKSDTPEDPYGGGFFKLYRVFLSGCLRFRGITVMILGATLAIAIYGFTLLENSFFPDSTRPQFMVHYWLPQGTDIYRTSDDMKKLEKYIQGLPNVTSVGSFVGSGAPRFILTYTPEKQYTSYGLILVNLDDFHMIDPLMEKVRKHTDENFIDAQVNLRRFVLGPGKENSLEARFSGPDPNILRDISEQAKKIMVDDGGAVGIKDDWRERVSIIQPVFSESPARLAGISKSNMDDTLNMTFTGSPVGIYRDQDKLLTIVSRAPDIERLNAENIQNVHIWSPVAQQTIPLRQIISRVDTVWEDSIIQRRDRKRTITTQASQKSGNASVVFERIRPKFEAIPLPVGYELNWGGEYEDAGDAQTALFSKIPMTIILMLLVLVFMFNAVRQPLIIMLTVPLAIIGVTIGLLVTGQSFGFMALLGFLSLAGMLIKNSIVLIDQIDLEVREGKPLIEAILDSSVSRLRPVSMAAVTTVLGMVPLVFDIFFIAMAVTIMAGLTFATILTLIFVPVLYAIFFSSTYRKQPDATTDP